MRLCQKNTTILQACYPQKTQLLIGFLKKSLTNFPKYERKQKLDYADQIALCQQFLIIKFRGTVSNYIMVDVEIRIKIIKPTSDDVSSKHTYVQIDSSAF